MIFFLYNVLAQRVVFGAGALDHLAREVALLGAQRVLVLSTPGQQALAAGVARLLGARSAGISSNAVMHVPIESVRAAREEAKRLRADCAVCCRAPEIV